jgi:hypothetical protein
MGYTVQITLEEYKELLEAKIRLEAITAMLSDTMATECACERIMLENINKVRGARV